ncbi:MAG: response regulator [Planctomycetota bacterium]
MDILYVENHAAFARQVTTAFLGSHEVTVVPTIRQARTELAAHNWDAVLIDYDLDDGKGIELVLELACKTPRPHLIAVSAFEHKNQEMMKGGADAQCSKLDFKDIGATLAGLEKSGTGDYT